MCAKFVSVWLYAMPSEGSLRQGGTTRILALFHVVKGFFDKNVTDVYSAALFAGFCEEL